MINIHNIDLSNPTVLFVFIALLAMAFGIGTLVGTRVGFYSATDAVRKRAEKLKPLTGFPREKYHVPESVGRKNRT